MSNLDKYFIWERPCFPGFVYIAAEACVIPHIKYFGRPWDNTLCFFSNGLIRGIWRKEKMVENGIYITKNFLDPAYYQSKIKDYRQFTDNLFVWFEKLDNINWQSLSDEEFLSAHRDYNRDFLAWWGFAQVSDLLGMGAEALLKEKYNLPNDQMSVLTAMTYKSYTTAQEEEILLIVEKILAKPELAKMFKEKSAAAVVKYITNNEPDLGKSLTNHAQKYFWMLNSYSETKKLDAEYFVDVAQELLRQDLTPASIQKIITTNACRLGDYKIQITELEQKLNFSAEEKKLVEFIDYFTYFQDERKAISLRANYYTDLFIKEVARRGHLSYDLAKFLMPQEYESAVRGEFPLERCAQRKKHFGMLFWKTGLEVLEGEESKRREEEILGTLDEKNISEFEGVRAMGGRVTGRVRKIMQLSELSSMQDGEILVTTMTSPDFITAMKKAVAVVTDQGGVTCHAAVIARELGIPCVIGTQIATRVLDTGDEVEVRANHGIIHIINKN